MLVLKRVDCTAGGPGGPLVVPLTAAGVVFVAERRGYHAELSSTVVLLHDGTVTSGPGGHCRLWLADGAVLVTDSGSDNGTWVRRGNLTTLVGGFRHPFTLQRGDVLVMGRHQYLLTDVSSADAPALPQDNTPAAGSDAPGANKS